MSPNLQEFVTGSQRNKKAGALKSSSHRKNMLAHSAGVVRAASLLGDSFALRFQGIEARLDRLEGTQKTNERASHVG